MSEMICCPFCSSSADEMSEFEQIRPCGCGAICWLEFEEDLDFTLLTAMEELRAETAEEVEISIVRNYTVLLDDAGQLREEGKEVCMVFARRRLK